MRPNPVRGRGSNQHADKPPELRAEQPVAAGVAASAAGAAMAAPFSAPAAPSSWEAEMDTMEATVEAELQEAIAAERERERKEVEDAREFLARSPEPRPGETDYYHNRARTTIANEEFVRNRPPLSSAIVLARAKSQLFERARADTDQLEAAGLPSDAVILEGPNDRTLAETLRKDPDSGRFNLEIHHDDGTVEHMTRIKPVSDGQWGYHSSIVTDRGNTYWRQRRHATTQGGYPVEGSTKGDWPDNATIIVRRPFDTTVDNQVRLDQRVSRNFGW